MKPKLKNPLDVFRGATTVGGLVKSWRTNFEIPHKEMAFVCGISQANLRAIENGRKNVGPRIALRLSAYMGLSPEVILYPKGFDTEPEFKEVKKRKEKLTLDKIETSVKRGISDAKSGRLKSLGSFAKFVDEEPILMKKTQLGQETLVSLNEGLELVKRKNNLQTNTANRTTKSPKNYKKLLKGIR